MYTTIKGRYEKGKLILEEPAPVDESEVYVIFLSEIKAEVQNESAVQIKLS